MGQRQDQVLPWKWEENTRSKAEAGGEVLGEGGWMEGRNAAAEQARRARSAPACQTAKQRLPHPPIQTDRQD